MVFVWIKKVTALWGVKPFLKIKTLGRKILQCSVYIILLLTMKGELVFTLGLWKNLSATRAGMGRDRGLSAFQEPVILQWQRQDNKWIISGKISAEQMSLPWRKEVFLQPRSAGRRCALRRSRWVSVSRWFSAAAERERSPSRRWHPESYFSPLAFPSSYSSCSLRWKILRFDLHLRRQLCSDGKVLSLKDNQTD